MRRNNGSIMGWMYLSGISSVFVIMEAWELQDPCLPLEKKRTKKNIRENKAQPQVWGEAQEHSLRHGLISRMLLLLFFFFLFLFLCLLFFLLLLLFFSSFSLLSPTSPFSYILVQNKVHFLIFFPHKVLHPGFWKQVKVKPYVFDPIRNTAFASGKECGIHSWILPPGVEIFLAASLTDGHGASAGKPSLGNFAHTHYHHHSCKWGGVLYPTYIATKLFFLCPCSLEHQRTDTAFATT